MKAKVLYVVLDGAPDGLSAPKRTLEEAHKPNIDSLARNAICGGVYTIAKGIAPESDMAVMSLLGYDPHRFYTGRGVIEAIGSGVEFKDGWVAFRANFATIDIKTRRLIDRRVGRTLTSREARELGKVLDGILLKGGEAEARFKATVGHRGVLVIKHKFRRLSANVSNSDPAYERKGYLSVARTTFEPYLQEIKPLDNREESRLTAELANEFINRAIEILTEHPLNIDRINRGLLPANAVLLRDASDRLPPVRPIEETYGLKLASIVEMPVERGLAIILGLHDIKVDIEDKDRRDLLREEAILALKALENFDGVYVHLKGPDEPGHDGSLEGKVKAIEEIDRYFFNEILNLVDIGKTLIVVTSDHATPWHLRSHSDDPVPLMISNPTFKEGHRKFSERCCYKGSLGLIEGAYNIIPKILGLIKTI